MNHWSTIHAGSFLPAAETDAIPPALPPDSTITPRADKCLAWPCTNLDAHSCWKTRLTKNWNGTGRLNPAFRKMVPDPTGSSWSIRCSGLPSLVIDTHSCAHYISQIGCSMAQTSLVWSKIHPIYGSLGASKGLTLWLNPLEVPRLAHISHHPLTSCRVSAIDSWCIHLTILHDGMEIIHTLSIMWNSYGTLPFLLCI